MTVLRGQRGSAARTLSPADRLSVSDGLAAGAALAASAEFRSSSSRRRDGSSRTSAAAAPHPEDWANLTTTAATLTSSAAGIRMSNGASTSGLPA
jgi:hypothetical protein